MKLFSKYFQSVVKTERKGPLLAIKMTWKIIEFMTQNLQSQQLMMILDYLFIANWNLNSWNEFIRPLLCPLKSYNWIIPPKSFGKNKKEVSEKEWE